MNCRGKYRSKGNGHTQYRSTTMKLQLSEVRVDDGTAQSVPTPTASRMHSFPSISRGNSFPSPLPSRDVSEVIYREHKKCGSNLYLEGKSQFSIIRSNGTTG